MAEGALRTDLLHFTRGAVPTRDGTAAHAAAVDDVGIQRIGRDIRVLRRAHRMPFAKSDLAVVAAAGHTRRSALLLAAIDPVGHLVVGNHVIKLRGRLVVPGTPGAAVVHADGGALVESQQNDVGVFRIDPDRVIVIAAGRALDGREAGAGVGGPISGGVGDVNHVFVLGVDAHAGEIRAASVDAILAVDLLPGSAGVIGAIQPRTTRGGFSRICATRASAALKSCAPSFTRRGRHVHHHRWFRPGHTCDCRRWARCRRRCGRALARPWASLRSVDSSCRRRRWT